jgi:shikimate dehydrogenase
MKKYIVIGNPIEHSLSPKLHNYWIKENNIDAVYDKKRIDHSELENIIFEVKEGKISGINVTVPFKKAAIPFLDELSTEANKTQSVNTIYLNNGKIIGHNTDAAGFELAIKYLKYNINNKRIFILGAGGVVPSIIFSLNKMQPSKIILSNRTRDKAENLKELFKNVEIINWGEMPDFDMIINATSLGLKKEDEIKLDISNVGNNKIFYDVIYNPIETNFLKKAKNLGHRVENGKMMFVYQAHQAFTLWHKVMPKIDSETIKLLDQ